MFSYALPVGNLNYKEMTRRQKRLSNMFYGCMMVRPESVTNSLLLSTTSIPPDIFRFNGLNVRRDGYIVGTVHTMQY